MCTKGLAVQTCDVLDISVDVAVIVEGLDEGGTVTHTLERRQHQHLTAKVERYSEIRF